MLTAAADGSILQGCFLASTEPDLTSILHSILPLCPILGWHTQFSSPTNISVATTRPKIMGNSSSSLWTQYMELVQGLLHSIGVKASTRGLSELFRLVKQYYHWFQYQTKLQLNLKEWKIIQKELRKQHQKGNVIPLKLWTLCSAITQALTLLSTDNETCFILPGTSHDAFCI